ncbi:MAG: hypothetical protein HY708_02005, partial [Ignavibacteriae bacterium]|nr:hypothetical protein [Ignavibacteriota bacterium]
MKRGVLLIAVLAIVAAVSLGIFSGASSPTISSGSKAPMFTLKDVWGKE